MYVDMCDGSCYMYMFVVECVVVCHGGGVSWWWCVGGMGGGGGGGDRRSYDYKSRNLCREVWLVGLLSGFIPVLWHCARAMRTLQFMTSPHGVG